MKRNSFLALILAASTQAAQAQNDAPTAAAPSSPAPISTGSKTADGVASQIDNTTSTALDYLFNHKPGEGTGAKAGSEVANAIADKVKAVDVLKTPVLDDPETRARFQTYLSLKEITDDRIKEYFGKMTQTSEQLKAGNTFAAWKLLYSLSDYKDLDAGISRELANRVETIWNTIRTQNGLAMANDKLRDNIDTYNHNADLMAETIRQEEIQNTKGGKDSGGSGGTAGSNKNFDPSILTNSPVIAENADPAAAEAAVMPGMASSMQGKLQLTAEYLKLLEARAKITRNEMQADKMNDQARMDFTDYIKTLYKSHRYYHVILAADFYRAIFNEGDYPKDISNQVVAGAANTGRTAIDTASQLSNAAGVNSRGPLNAINQLSGALGVDHFGVQPGDNQPMSLADEVTAALEINHRVTQAIEVFRYKADKGEIAAAAEQLQQAFVGNEYHPGLQGLPRVEKEKVGDFLRKLDVLKNQLEVRDFEQVEGQITDIKKVANDFDATKPMALVNAIKLESRLRLGKARLLAQGGRLTEAMMEFQTAAEEWPGNPDLQTSSTSFFSSEDMQNQSVTEFDRLINEQNYRTVFDKQLAFAPAIKGDAARVQQLKDAIIKVQKAEMASEKANAMLMNGDADGAWETIELAAKDWPDDMKLNKLLASLSSRSADFVSALNKARDAEAKKELGYSLTWYVNAQGLYPSSLIANAGIERTRNLILSPHDKAN